MCIERVHRLLMATVIGGAALLGALGYTAAIYFLALPVAMIVVWGITGFCPSEWAIKKTGMKPCHYIA